MLLRNVVVKIGKQRRPNSGHLFSILFAYQKNNNDIIEKYSLTFLSVSKKSVLLFKFFQNIIYSQATTISSSS